MKKKQYIILLILLAPLIFMKCVNSDKGSGNTGLPEDPIDEDKVEIEMVTTGIDAIDLQTRAVTDFPNNQTIGVIAAEYNGGTVDWTTYADINNTPAKVTKEENGLFYFSFAETKYWPLDGTSLVFLAYSPIDTDNSAVVLNNAHTGIQMSLQNNMPDILYASGNEDALDNPRSKIDKRFHLGEFRHALSQVTIKVEADESMNPNVTFDQLSVETDYPSAFLNLLEGANGLSVNTASSPPFVYTLVTTSTSFNTTSYTADVLLFPGTESGTRVNIRLRDGGYTLPLTFSISDFVNESTGLKDVAFEMGKNTTLVLTVKGTEVTQPTPDIHLQGLLTDWKDRGVYEIGIK